MASISALYGNKESAQSLVGKHRGDDPHHVFKVEGGEHTEIISHVGSADIYGGVENRGGERRQGGGRTHADRGDRCDGSTASLANQDEATMDRSHEMDPIQTELQSAHQPKTGRTSQSRESEDDSTTWYGTIRTRVGRLCARRHVGLDGG
jgi:hypothetical protein